MSLNVELHIAQTQMTIVAVDRLRTVRQPLNYRAQRHGYVLTLLLLRCKAMQTLWLADRYSVHHVLRHYARFVAFSSQFMANGDSLLHHRVHRKTDLLLS